MGCAVGIGRHVAHWGAAVAAGRRLLAARNSAMSLIASLVVCRMEDISPLCSRGPLMHVNISNSFGDVKQGSTTSECVQ